jgi:hypothetical protein
MDVSVTMLAEVETLDVVVVAVTLQPETLEHDVPFVMASAKPANRDGREWKCN